MLGTAAKWSIYASPKGGIHHSALKTAGKWGGGPKFTDFSNFNMLAQTLLKPNKICLWTTSLQLLVSVSVFLWAPPQVIRAYYKVIWCTRTNNDACLYFWFTSQSNSAEHLQLFRTVDYFPFFPNTQDPVSSLEGNINLCGDKKLWICTTIHALR